MVFWNTSQWQQAKANEISMTSQIRNAAEWADETKRREGDAKKRHVQLIYD